MKFEKALLLDIVYGYEPMNRSLAEAIKELRCEKKCPFETIPYGLNQGFVGDFSLGKELCKKAKLFLQDSDPRWD